MEGFKLKQFQPKNQKQAGTELAKAQFNLELELGLTSIKICCIKLIKLVESSLLSGESLLIPPLKSDLK